MKTVNPFKLDGVRPLPEKALEVLDQLEDPSRRNFLKTAGIMMVGFGAAAATADAQSPINPSGNVDIAQVDNWVAIGADGDITVFAGKCELGTGMRTLQHQLAAEELSVPMERITLVLCRTGITPNQGYTAGSFSAWTQFGTGGLRAALDTARDALYQLASQYLNADVKQLTLKDGVFAVAGGDPTYTVSYGDLVAGQRFNLAVNPRAVPNDSSTWKVLGKSVPRVEIPAKAKGSFQYVHKVRVPGMLHGKVVRPPALGAHLRNYNPGALAGMPGNPQIVTVMDFVGVVADTEWNATKAAKALAPTIIWSDGDPMPDQATFYSWLTQQPSRDSFSVDTGDVDKVMGTAAKTVSAQYLHPYHMHGSLASSCAVADVRGGTGARATVKAWSATQSVYNVRTYLASLLNIPAANIQVTNVEGSGCYGGNGADGVTFDAALLSQAVGRPVRLQYTRADEMAGGEQFGRPFVINHKVGLDANGTIIAWDAENVLAQKGEGALGVGLGGFIQGSLAGFPTTKIVPTTTPAPAAVGFFGFNFSNSTPPYLNGRVNGQNYGNGKVASQRVLNRIVEGPLWTAYLRSPDHLQNTWGNESFMDEVAASVQADPVQYRLRHLTDQRLIDVVNAVAQKAGWETRPSPKSGNARTGVVSGRGFSCVVYSGFDGWCAVAAEVTVDQDKGIIAVKKVTAGLDTGPVLSPDGLRNQMEGQVIQGISRAVFEEVKWDKTTRAVTSDDWVTYNVLKFGDTIPEIQTVLIDNRKAIVTGAGETIITVIGSAIGNAVFDATGVRMRQIPMTSANFLAAKAAQKV